MYRTNGDWWLSSYVWTEWQNHIWNSESSDLVNQLIINYFSHGQKSWDQCVLVALYKYAKQRVARDSKCNLHVPSSSPHPTPPTLLKTCTRRSPGTRDVFSIVLSGRGGNCNGKYIKYNNTFRRNAQIVDNYQRCMTAPSIFFQDCNYYYSI